MKKILLASCLIITSSISMAENWTNSYFPEKDPIFYTIGKLDEDKLTKLNFSCTKDFKDHLLMTISSSNIMEESGTFSFKASKKDKLKTEISGKFSKSPDGVINLITGFEKDIILNDLKELNGVEITFSKSGKEIETLKYSLSGSSKNLNILNKKCNNFK